MPINNCVDFDRPETYDDNVNNFIELTDEVRNTLNQVDREGNRGQMPAAPASAKDQAVEYLYKFYINALLSPQTHPLNIVSNSFKVGTRLLETGMAAGVGKLNWNASERVHFQELVAEASGIVEGTRDAFNFLGQIAKHPQTALERLLEAKAIPARLAEQAKIEFQHRLSSNVQIDNAILRNAARYVDKVISLNGSSLTTADIFYKIIHYRAESAKQAMRQAIREASQNGHDRAWTQQRSNMLRDTMIHNPDALPGIEDTAIRNADVQTWTNKPSGRWNAVMVGKDMQSGLLRWIMPFRRTIANIVNDGIESTPLGLFNSKVIEDLKAGGIRQQEALGKMATGTLLISSLSYALGDYIDGQAPRNYQERDLWEKNGHKEYSIRVGGKHLPLDSFGQISPFLKALADYSQYAAQISYISDDNADSHIMDAAGKFVLETAAQLTDSHWFMSLAGFGATINQWVNDPDRNPEPLERFASKWVGGFYPNALKSANTFVDPYEHDTADFNADPFAGTKAKIFGLSDDIARKVNLWGDYITYDNNLTPEMADPITHQDEVFKELKRVGTNIPISRRVKHGVRMTPREYETFMVIAGKGVPGVPSLRDQLKQNIESPLYKSWAHNEGRALMLENVIQSYRDAASDYMATHDKEFRARIDKAMELKKESLRRQ